MVTETDNSKDVVKEHGSNDTTGPGQRGYQIELINHGKWSAMLLKIFA